MKDNRINELIATAEPVETEDKQAASEFGKFKSVKALMDAYTALEAEFTRRSQRLKELEANKAQTEPVNADNPETPSQRAEKAELPAQYAADKPLSDDVKTAVIEEYLNSVRRNRSVPFVTGGGAVTAARRTPATVSEAGTMAIKFLNNQGDK